MMSIWWLLLVVPGSIALGVVFGWALAVTPVAPEATPRHREHQWVYIPENASTFLSRASHISLEFHRECQRCEMEQMRERASVPFRTVLYGNSPDGVHCLSVEDKDALQVPQNTTPSVE